MSVAPPPAPLPRLSLGVTGHRPTNAAFAANRAQVDATLRAIFARIDQLTTAQSAIHAPVRLHSLLAAGVDQLAAGAALEWGWELVVPLPFGRLLNRAINAAPATVEDARALLAGQAPTDPEAGTRAQDILRHEEEARLFELVDQDEATAAALIAMLEAPADAARTRLFNSLASAQVALAGKVMIEQSDLVIGVWDGLSPTLTGGTGQTIIAALALGVPVLLVDPAHAEDWAIVTTPEELANPSRRTGADLAKLDLLVRAALRPDEQTDPRQTATLVDEHWHDRSSRLWLGYRLIERTFGEGRLWPGRLRVMFERPGDIATGSGAGVLAAARSLPEGDQRLAQDLATRVLPDFAWADGISTWLSDAYRSGMVANFGLSAFAVLAGLAYQPLGFDHGKWMFAGVEFLLLTQILLLTWFATRKRWHQRWFDTRRVAEYLRHAPILLMLGISLPSARWPRGKGTQWPEYHARHRLRELGLPRTRVTRAYLRAALEGLLLPHVIHQRDYHRAKASRLGHVHHRLDRLAVRLFIAAVVAVSIYLGIEMLALAGMLPHDLPHRVSKLFTFLGVAFPTLAASISAVRFFGDFERFAAISEVTSQKLDAVAGRIANLLEVPCEGPDYAAVADLARAIEDITISEVESWQAVFGGKHVALPA